MGERTRTAIADEMATTSTAVATVPPQTQEEPAQPIAVITLRPTRAQPRKKVVWAEDTVDNEHMNKKKSKCCCIYEKPHKFDESDSESDEDECEHCYGHVELKRKKKEECQQPGTSTETQVVDGPNPEPTTTVSLRPEPAPAPTPPDKPTS